MTEDLLLALGEADANDYLCSNEIRPSKRFVIAYISKCFKNPFVRSKYAVCMVISFVTFP